MLSSEIIQSLKSYRKEHADAGYITESWSQNPLVQSRVMQELSKDVNLKQRIATINKSLAQYKEISYEHADDIKAIASQIVDEALVDKINNPYKYSLNNGFTEQQAKYFENLYYQAKSEYTQFMTDFISKFTRAEDVSFM